jgi:pyoverdine/dityrosine biosynthesis protein Dit1
MPNVSFGTLIDVVQSHASTYEKALTDLQKSANSSKSDSSGSLGEVSITEATVATTRVQLTQSLTEMATGIAKNAADHTKGLGRKIGGG